ncbi:hypothetical protein [Metabacillus fastidiosus]|uniref:hypothetical protein n=1 Tax=Metabacillus fastidiosus TaxID=1458 RepID=UPI003D2CB631
MKLVINKNLSNNNYEVTIDIVDITLEEQELIKDFGNPSINIGGTLTEDDGLGGTITVATLGDQFKTLPLDIPLTRTFTQAQYGLNAQKVADTYAKVTSDKIQAAITALKAKSDSFSGTTEVML